MEIITQELLLRHPFRIANSPARTHVSRLLIHLYGSPEEGGGIGEADPSPLWGETAETARTALEALATMIGNCPEDPRLLRQKMDECLTGNHAAKSAMDMATWDAYCKRLGVPVYKFLGLDPNDTPCTSFTIGIDDLPAMQMKVEEADPYPILKIKVGTDRDLECMQRIRSLTDKTLRVDANAAWTPDEAIEKIRIFEDFGVELVEQPVEADNYDGLKKVRDAVNIPVIADESVRTAKEIPLLDGVVDGINIKLNKCGGVSSALEMIAAAREHGMKVMIGCMVSTSVAITAAAHLSPLVDYADLDGNLLIQNDPYTGVTVEHGKLSLPARPGLGLVRR